MTDMLLAREERRSLGGVDRRFRRIGAEPELLAAAAALEAPCRSEDVVMGAPFTASELAALKRLQDVRIGYIPADHFARLEACAFAALVATGIRDDQRDVLARITPAGVAYTVPS